MRRSSLFYAAVFAAFSSTVPAWAEKPHAADAIAAFLDAFAAPRPPASDSHAHGPSCGCAAPPSFHCPTCGLDAACGCEPTCLIEPTCAAEPTCGIEPTMGAHRFQAAPLPDRHGPVRLRLRSYSSSRKIDPSLAPPRPGMYGIPVARPVVQDPPAVVAPAPSAPVPVMEAEPLPPSSAIPQPRVEMLPSISPATPAAPEPTHPAPPKPLSKANGGTGEFQFVPRTPPMLPRTLGPSQTSPVSPPPASGKFDRGALRSAYDIQKTGGVVTAAPEIRPALRLAPVEAVPLPQSDR